GGEELGVGGAGALEGLAATLGLAAAQGLGGAHDLVEEDEGRAEGDDGEDEEGEDEIAGEAADHDGHPRRHGRLGATRLALLGSPIMTGILGGTAASE